MSLLSLLKGRALGCVDYADCQNSLQLLTSSHLRERDKHVVKSLFLWEVWNGFLLDKAKKEDVPCRFCGCRDGDGHLFLGVYFSPPLARP